MPLGSDARAGNHLIIVGLEQPVSTDVRKLVLLKRGVAIGSGLALLHLPSIPPATQSLVLRVQLIARSKATPPRPSQTRTMLSMSSCIYPDDKASFNQVLDAAGGDTYVGIWFSENYTIATLKIHDADTHKVTEEHAFRANPGDAEAYEKQARTEAQQEEQ